MSLPWSISSADERLLQIWDPALISYKFLYSSWLTSLHRLEYSIVTTVVSLLQSISCSYLMSRKLYTLIRGRFPYGNGTSFPWIILLLLHVILLHHVLCLNFNTMSPNPKNVQLTNVTEKPDLQGYLQGNTGSSNLAVLLSAFRGTPVHGHIQYSCLMY